MRKPPEPLHHGEIPTLPLHTAGSLIKRRGCLHELISAPAGDRQLPREVPPTSNCMGPDASGATANIARQYDKLRHSSLLELLPRHHLLCRFFGGTDPLVAHSLKGRTKMKSCQQVVASQPFTETQRCSTSVIMPLESRSRVAVRSITLLLTYVEHRGQQIAGIPANGILSGVVSSSPPW